MKKAPHDENTRSRENTPHSQLLRILSRYVANSQKVTLYNQDSNQSLTQIVYT